MNHEGLRLAVDVQGLEVDLAGEPRGSWRRVLHGVDLAVPEAQVVALVGASGAGKTVLARALVGALPATAQISAQRWWVGEQRVGWIPQDVAGSLNPLRRVGRQVADVIRLQTHRPRRDAGRQARQLLARVGLVGTAQYFPSQLSGGMAQRVCIAMALARQPRVLVADEPTAALDPGTGRQIADLLREVVAEHAMALLLITHQMDLVARLASRIYVLRAGTLVEASTAEDFLAGPRHPYSRALWDAGGVRGWYGSGRADD